jgi:hypothetical protein
MIWHVPRGRSIHLRKTDQRCAAAQQRLTQRGRVSSHSNCLQFTARRDRQCNDSGDPLTVKDITAAAIPCNAFEDADAPRTVSETKRNLPMPFGCFIPV